MASKRNGVIELMRFLMSLFVVGYHTRLAADYGGNSMFEYGYFAVEFFFVLSGFLLAGSLERAYASENNVFLDTGKFMWKKVKALLPYHLTAVVLMIAVLGAFDAAFLGERLASGGWTGIFLVQSFVVWTTCEGIVMQEWYLSTMLLVMLLVYPLSRLLAKKIKKRVFIPVVLLCLLGVVAIAVGFGTNWQFAWNFSVDLRGFGEMCLGMMLFYLSRWMKGKELSRGADTALAVAEGACYVVAFVLMCLPFDIMGAIGIPVVMAVSLPLYILHPVVTELATRAFGALPAAANVIVCFLISLALTAAVYAAYKGITHAVRKGKTPPAPPAEQPPADECPVQTNVG